MSPDGRAPLSWAGTLVFLFIIPYLTDASSDYRILQGYDCDQLVGSGDVSLDTFGACGHAETVRASRNITYQLLQREKQREMAGTSCKMVETQQARYCGVYDHQTIFSQLSYTMIPISLSTDLCQLMKSQGYYEDPNGGRHKLQVPGITHIQYELKGQTTVVDGEIKCEGETFKWDGVLYHNMILDRNVQVYIENETFLEEQGQVTAYKDNVHLECPMSLAGCETATATYIWTPLTDTCPLAYTRFISGIEVEDERGQAVFMSTDGSLVRVINHGPTSYCGRVVFKTNYPDLFLYPYEEPELFTREIRPGEVAITTYISNRDDFLYHDLLNKVEEELNLVLDDDCERNRDDSKFRFWLQHADPGLTTYILGNGTFATTAGEVMYRYRCPPVLVRAQETLGCFQSLPVIPVQEGNHTEVGGVLYLEPLTRRLTTQGIPIPCSEEFPAKFQNIYGDWLMATPSLHPAAPPAKITTLTTGQLSIPDQDYSRGGVYTEERLQDMRDYVYYGRTKDSVLARLVHQSSYTSRSQETLEIRDLFPTYVPPELTWKGAFLQYCHDFLNYFGEGASILVASYLIGSLCFNLFSWLYKGTILYDVHGCGSQLFWVLCPNLLLFRHYHADNSVADRPPAYYPSTKEFVRSVDISQSAASFPAPPPPPPPQPSLSATNQTYVPSCPQPSGVYPSLRPECQRPSQTA